MVEIFFNICVIADRQSLSLKIPCYFKVALWKNKHKLIHMGLFFWVFLIIVTSSPKRGVLMQNWNFFCSSFSQNDRYGNKLYIFCNASIKITNSEISKVKNSNQAIYFTSLYTLLNNIIVHHFQRTCFTQ